MSTTNAKAVSSTKKTANKTTGTAMPGKRATIAIGPRVVRTGTPVPSKTFIQTMTQPTQHLLKTLSDKFGIVWGKTAYDNTLPAKAKSGPAHSFLFEGTLGKKKVFYDRFQFIFFVKGGFPNQRAKAHTVADMTKAQFQKHFLANQA